MKNLIILYCPYFSQRQLWDWFPTFRNLCSRREYCYFPAKNDCDWKVIKWHSNSCIQKQQWKEKPFAHPAKYAKRSNISLHRRRGGGIRIFLANSRSPSNPPSLKSIWLIFLGSGTSPQVTVALLASPNLSPTFETSYKPSFPSPSSKTCSI